MLSEERLEFLKLCFAVWLLLYLLASSSLFSV